MVKNDDLVPLACLGGVQHFTRQVAAGVWNHNEGFAERTSLRLMHGQRIGQFKRWRTLLRIEFPRLVLVGNLGLRGQLNFDFVRRSISPPGPAVPGDNADVAVGNTGIILFRIGLAPALVDDGDSFVTVDDSLWAGRAWDLLVRLSHVPSVDTGAGLEYRTG
ncbi:MULTISPECIES: hypothetical protein [Pandoraea]|uniref:hypothetical protein n=1 Tax=Pandoraea TaxID=93217 RepID=UPI001E603CC6|nr:MULTISPECIES: hypothetical protein [Pandoraea]